MEERKVWLDAERFVACQIKASNDKCELYSCPKGRGAEVLKAMLNNGMVVTTYNLGMTDFVVDRTQMNFQGERFCLNQCSDIWEWFSKSKEGEFTYYYDRVVFHCSDGIYAGYREDINNYMKI